MLLLSGGDMECACINFGNEEKVFLWDDIYLNLSEIRLYLKENFKEKARDVEPKTKVVALPFLEKKLYKGNSLFSISTLYLLIIIIALGIPFKSHIFNTGYFFTISIFVLIFFFTFGTQMNYFIVEDESITIKNHYFLWKHKVFKLIDINELVIEVQNRRSNCLRVITKEFESTKFAASTLRNKHWRAFRNDMIELGLPVRTEASILY